MEVFFIMAIDIKEARKNSLDMTFSEFLSNCTACGGNWGAMLLTGIKRVFPDNYEEVEKKYNSMDFSQGGVYPFMFLCEWLTAHGIVFREGSAEFRQTIDQFKQVLGSAGAEYCHVYGKITPARDKTIYVTISEDNIQGREKISGFMSRYGFRCAFRNKLDYNIDMDATLVYSRVEGFYENSIKE